MGSLAEHLPLLASLATALGIGLLIGAERERRKHMVGVAPPAAGLRTFAIVSLLGAVSYWLGEATLLAVSLVVVTGMVALSYTKTSKDDPGMTTEVALILTVLIGGATIKLPEIAAVLGVLLVGLLAARDPMHKFVKHILSGEEMNDALILAAATLIVLPLMPNEMMGPYEAINPQKIWLVVVLVLTISAAGHVASRVLGAQRGLPLAGLFSGFISSTMTIAAMGGRARAHPELVRPAAAGAVLSTIASLLQLGVVLLMLSPVTLKHMLAPLLWAMAAAVLYGLTVAMLARGRRTAAEEIKQQGHAFSLKTAAYFAAFIGLILVIVAALNDMFGQSGVLIATAIAGIADTHAPAASIASLVTAGKIAAGAAVVPVMLALSVNTGTRVVLAATAGNRTYALIVIPGLLLMLMAGWAGLKFGLPGLTG